MSSKSSNEEPADWECTCGIVNEGWRTICQSCLSHRDYAQRYYTRMKRIAEGIHDYDATYLGGLSMYADKRNVKLSVCPNEVVIDALELHIPYSIIKEVKNVNESQIKALRVIALGVVGALWKKKENFLCLVYNDGIQDQNPVFRVDKLDMAQRDIYQHVVKTKLPPQPH